MTQNRHVLPRKVLDFSVNEPGVAAVDISLDHQQRQDEVSKALRLPLPPPRLGLFRYGYPSPAHDSSGVSSGRYAYNHDSSRYHSPSPQAHQHPELDEHTRVEGLATTEPNQCLLLGRGTAKSSLSGFNGSAEEHKSGRAWEKSEWYPRIDKIDRRQGLRDAPYDEATEPMSVVEYERRSAVHRSRSCCRRFSGGSSRMDTSSDSDYKELGWEIPEDRRGWGGMKRQRGDANHRGSEERRARCVVQDRKDSR